MEICCCVKCQKWFDVDDSYDEIVIGKKSGDDYYEMLHLCQKCVKKIHKAIDEILSKKADPTE